MLMRIILKIVQVDKLYSQLQKKMDNRRAELENLLRDNRELEDQCGHLQEWLGDYSRRLIDSLLVKLHVFFRKYSNLNTKTCPFDA